MALSFFIAILRCHKKGIRSKRHLQAITFLTPLQYVRAKMLPLSFLYNYSPLHSVFSSKFYNLWRLPFLLSGENVCNDRFQFKIISSFRFKIILSFKDTDLTLANNLYSLHVCPIQFTNFTILNDRQSILEQTCVCFSWAR